MNYTIREIQEKDYLEVVVLYKKLRIKGSKYMFPFYEKIRRTWKLLSDEKIINQVIIPKAKKENSKFYVLEVENRIWGFVYGVLDSSNHEVYEDLNYVWWELCHIYVDDEFRGNWFAIKLRDQLFWYFSKNNVKVIEIWVNQTNPAIKMYEKWWFKSDFCYLTKEINEE